MSQTKVRIIDGVRYIQAKDTDLLIEFDDAISRHSFAVWLCDCGGEQQYCDWDIQGEPTLDFVYHTPGMGGGYDAFLADGRIRTRRVDSGDE